MQTERLNRIESTFPNWLTSLFTAIDPLFPAPNGFTPISPDDLPPPRIRLTPISDKNGGASGLKLSNGKQTSPFPGWSDDNGFARVTKLERLTEESWFQDVRNLELEIEGGTSYEAGDVLEIRPHNSAADVQKFIDNVGWQDLADIEYEISATSPGMSVLSSDLTILTIYLDQPLPHHLPSPLRTTIRNLLQYELDIQSIPRVSFFEWLAGFSDGDMKEKLNWFCSGEGQVSHFPSKLLPVLIVE